LIAAGLSFALLAFSDESGPATAAKDRSRDSVYPERPISGLVATLPFVGTLVWHCEEKGFVTQLFPPDATIFASLVADGKRVWKHRRVDPLPDPRTKLVVGSPGFAQRSQTWTITYRHAPATIRVTARLRFRRSDSQCVVARSAISTRRIPHRVAVP
jgi:hypothetical protein